jgi:hypothetical protein
MDETTDIPRGLKRHAALLPLSRDHHFVLIHALALRRAAGASLRAGRGAVATAESYLAFYNDEMLGHMSDEEEALLPRSSHVSPEDAGRVVTEHEDLRERTALLRQALLDGLDPRPVMLELAEHLHDHVRFEERIFFETIQAALPRPQMEAIGRALEAHRAARGRGTGCSLLPPGILPARSVDPEA